MMNSRRVQDWPLACCSTPVSLADNRVSFLLSWKVVIFLGNNFILPTNCSSTVQRIWTSFHYNRMKFDPLPVLRSAIKSQSGDTVHCVHLLPCRCWSKLSPIFELNNLEFRARIRSQFTTVHAVTNYYLPLCVNTAPSVCIMTVRDSWKGLAETHLSRLTGLDWQIYIVYTLECLLSDSHYRTINGSVARVHCRPTVYCSDLAIYGKAARINLRFLHYITRFNEVISQKIT